MLEVVRNFIIELDYTITSEENYSEIVNMLTYLLLEKTPEKVIKEVIDSLYLDLDIP